MGASEADTCGCRFVVKKFGIARCLNFFELFVQNYQNRKLRNNRSSSSSSSSSSFQLSFLQS